MLLVFCSSSNLFAQVVGGVQTKGMDMNAQPFGFVKQISADTKEVVGNVYLNEWSLGTVEFINGSKLGNKMIRYNIENDFLEIKLDGVVKGAEGRNVVNFLIFNGDVEQRYVRASNFKFNGTSLVGFLQELHVGNYSLYSKTNVKLVKGTYVAALDMGEEDDEYSKKTIYYLGKNKELTEVSSNKKKFASNFTGIEGKVLEFIDESDLILKREADLIKVISYINTLNQ